MADENGSTKQEQLIITLTREPWQVTFGGTIKEPDLIIAALDQVKRHIETQLRISAGVAAQQAINEMKKEQTFAESFMKGSRG